MNTTTMPPPRRDAKRSAAPPPPTRQWVTGGVAVAVILAVIVYFLAHSGALSRADSLQGYYALRVNPAPGAPTDKLYGNMVFGFARLGLSGDHTFSLNQLEGTWSHSGDSLTLTPNKVPSLDQFYPKTTMVDALSVMRQPCRFTVSADGKTLTAVGGSGGPLVWTKVSDGMR